MKRIFKLSFLFATILAFTLACGKSSKSRPIAESVSSFLNGNETVISFGSIRLNAVLNKTGYQEEAKIRAFIDETFNQIKGAINLDSPIYFAVEGPVKEGNPAATYLFLEVKNSDSLKVNLTKNGFEVKEAGDFQYVSDGDMNLAFDKHLAAVIIKSDVTDEKAELTALRKKLNGNVSTGFVADVLNKKDDIVFGTSLTNLYQTSNTDLEDLSPDKQKELVSMLQNSFIDGGVNFNNGELIVEVNNHFSDPLKNKLFLLKDNNAKILYNIGKGTPKAGLSVNVDTKKLQEFLNDYAPNAIEDLAGDLGGPFAMAMIAADNDVSKLIDGRIGAFLFGDASNIIDGFIPDVNFFIGLAGQGKKFGETIKELLSDNFKKVELTNSGVAGYSSMNYVGDDIKLPASAKDFGKNSVDFFIDLSEIDAEEFDLDGGMKMLEMIKSISFKFDINGGKLVVKIRDEKENILKQALQKGLKLFEDQLAI